MTKLLLLMFSLLPTPSMVGQPQGPTTLEALRDHHRVLLVFGNGNNQLAEAQLTVAADHVDGFRERDLLLTGLQGTNATVPTARLSPADEAAARQRFHVAAGQFTVILIGKDGGEKLRSHKPIPWEKLQSTIDAMPMRKDEVRR